MNNRVTDNEMQRLLLENQQSEIMEESKIDIEKGIDSDKKVRTYNIEKNFDEILQLEELVKN